MKKTILAVAVLTAAISCNSNIYTINGTISEDLVTKGAVVTMTDLATEKVDTAQIVDGKFTFTGDADNTSLRFVQLVTENKMRNMNNTYVIPEAGTITIDLDSTGLVSGTPINDSLVTFQNRMKEMNDEYMDGYQRISSMEVSDEEQTEIWQNYQDSMTKAILGYAEQTYNANKENALGLDAAQVKAGSIETAEEFDKFFADAPQFITDNKEISSAKKTLVALENTQEGKMFSDFKGKTKDGADASLSTFVGKGKYVLVDFWASWCGPCRGEIPNLIAVNNKYAKKGLVVLGVPVWDKRENTDKAIAELGINYDQLFIEDNDATPTETYGISGIPHIILFGPDGTIVKRGLRGDDIEKAVSEALKK